MQNSRQQQIVVPFQWLATYVARTLKKFRQVRIGFVKSSVFLENPTQVRFQKCRVGATKRATQVKKHKNIILST